MQTAAYFAVRGVKVADFLKMPLAEKVFYYEAMAREVEMENKRLEILIQVLSRR